MLLSTSLCLDYCQDWNGTPFREFTNGIRILLNAPCRYTIRLNTIGDYLIHKLTVTVVMVIIQMIRLVKLLQGEHSNAFVGNLRASVFGV